jgi:hypothetical protein
VVARHTANDLAHARIVEKASYIRYNGPVAHNSNNGVSATQWIAMVSRTVDKLVVPLAVALIGATGGVAAAIIAARAASNSSSPRIQIKLAELVVPGLRGLEESIRASRELQNKLEAARGELDRIRAENENLERERLDLKVRITTLEDRPPEQVQNDNSAAELQQTRQLLAGMQRRVEELEAPNRQPEDNRQLPLPIDVGRSNALEVALNTSVTGDVGFNNKAEVWYSFEVPEMGTLQYTVTNTTQRGVSNGSLGAAVLFDANKRKITSGGGLRPTQFRAVAPVAVSAGRYYLQVNQSPRSSAKYRIDVQFERG